MTFAAAVLAAGCVSSPSADLSNSRANLMRDPAYDLSPRGAQLVSNIGQEGRQTVTGEQPAAAGHVYRTSLDVAAVQAFYHTELTSRGWAVERRPILTTGEVDGLEWCRPDRIFRLAFSAQDPLGSRTFSAELIASRPPCPRVVAPARTFAAPTAPPRSP